MNSNPNFSKMTPAELRAFNIKFRRNSMKGMCELLREQESFRKTMIGHFKDLVKEEPNEIYENLLRKTEEHMELLQEGIRENCREYSNAELGAMVNRNAPSEEELDRLMAEARKGQRKSRRSTKRRVKGRR